MGWSSALGLGLEQVGGGLGVAVGHGLGKRRVQVIDGAALESE